MSEASVIERGALYEWREGDTPGERIRILDVQIDKNGNGQVTLEDAAIDGVVSVNAEAVREKEQAGEIERVNSSADAADWQFHQETNTNANTDTGTDQ